MAKKQYVPHYTVDSIEELVRYKANKVFYIKDLNGKDKILEWDVLRNLTFGTIVDCIQNKKLYIAKCVEIRKETPVLKNKIVEVVVGGKSIKKFDLGDVY